MPAPVPSKTLKLFEEFEPKKNGLDAFLKTLKSVEIGEVQTDKDKEVFVKLISSIKIAKDKIKVKKAEIETAFKPGIKDAEARVTELKQSLAEKLNPLKAISEEIERIETTSRASVNSFVNKGIEQAVKAAEVDGQPLLPHEKAMIMPGTDVVHAGGGSLSFRDSQAVKILDMDKIPRRFLDLKAAPDRVVKWLKEKLKVEGDLNIKVMADGTAQVRFNIDQLPIETTDKIGVLESKIIAAGGCEGVEIFTEKRAVVK